MKGQQTEHWIIRSHIQNQTRPKHVATLENQIDTDRRLMGFPIYGRPALDSGLQFNTDTNDFRFRMPTSKTAWHPSSNLLEIPTNDTYSIPLTYNSIQDVSLGNNRPINALPQVEDIILLELQIYIVSTQWTQAKIFRIMVDGTIVQSHGIGAGVLGYLILPVNKRIEKGQYVHLIIQNNTITADLALNFLFGFTYRIDV